MTHSLPNPVSAYFEISNGADIGGVERCFARDAEVRDEKRTHRGHEAIRSWQRESRAKFDYSVAPFDAFRDGDRVTVAATVSGNFPGSPVRLDHVFDLADGKIQTLEIR